MTKDEALKLALEALTNAYWPTESDLMPAHNIKECADAITAIKEALAQPEQTNTRPYYTIDELNAWADEKEKQAWRNAAIRIGEELSSVGPDGYYDMDAWKWLDWAMEQEPRGKNSLSQPEQEPVAWMVGHRVYGSLAEAETDWEFNPTFENTGYVPTPLYTTPPQRKPLSDEQIADSVREADLDWHQGWTLNDDAPNRFATLARAIEAAHGIYAPTERKGEA